MDGQIDDQMDKKWTNEWNFERNLVDFELESGNKNVDGQTDVGHINLIGGLVTCNPPKNSQLWQQESPGKTVLVNRQQNDAPKGGFRRQQ